MAFFNSKKERLKKEQEEKDRLKNDSKDFYSEYKKTIDDYYSEYKRDFDRYERYSNEKKKETFDDSRYNCNSRDFSNIDFGKLFDDDFLEQFFKKMQDQSNFNNNYRHQTTINKSNDSLNKSFQLMKLNKDDDDTIIKKRYRELSMKWHPDKWANDTTENQAIAGRNFVKLNNAYETIKKFKNMK